MTPPDAPSGPAALPADTPLPAPPPPPPPAAPTDRPAPEALAERFGSEGLRHLVYVSKAAPENKSEVLTDILKISRRKNHAAGITGLLVYFDGRFLQYLEGPGLAVGGTLSLIKADSRHYDLEILLDEATDRRLFRSWDMGCLDVGSEGWLRLVEADWPTIRPLKPNSESGLKVLQELAEHPDEKAERLRVLGGAAGIARPPGSDERLTVSDNPPELRAARLQLAGAVLVAVALGSLLLFEWLRR